MLKKSGLNDSDKILVTVALWISAISLFAATLSLPMLPDMVTIFYRSADGKATGEFYSKYNNLLIILVSVIPAAIVLISAALKKRQKIQNNFLSIMLFSIMLSLSMGGVIIYGIMQQFDSSSSVRFVNVHGLATMLVALFLSICSSVIPSGLHASSSSGAQKQRSDIKTRLLHNLDAHWNIGAYGYLLAAILSSFISDQLCYIPLAAAFLLHLIFLLAFGGAKKKPEAQASGNEQRYK